MENQHPEKTDNEQDRPPIFSSWNRLYVVLLLNLAIQVILFYLFMKAFE
jgi:hypothetical protein